MPSLRLSDRRLPRGIYYCTQSIRVLHGSLGSVLSLTPYSLGMSWFTTSSLASVV